MTAKGWMRWVRVALLATLVFPAVNFPAPKTVRAATYTENFDTLANSGTSDTLPTGWVLYETDSNANTTYTAGTGSNTAGDTYSFGESDSSERAFGGLQSSTLVPIIGAQFQNETGGTIVSLAISYYCEQWRLGATGRTDRLDFQYSTDATSLTTGTWTDVNALDCSSIVTSGTVGALNGNTQRTEVTGAITGLNIAKGNSYWIRWIDFDASGADDGLAIDDFNLTSTSTMLD